MNLQQRAVLRLGSNSSQPVSRGFCSRNETPFHFIFFAIPTQVEIYKRYCYKGRFPSEKQNRIPLN